MKKFVLILFQILILITINQLGVMISKWLSLPIPGNVLGMVILFLLLWIGVIRLQWVERASSLLTKHLAFFFIPISVGMMTLGTLFIDSGLVLLFILFISTFIGLLFSGVLAQVLIYKKEEVKTESHHHSL